MGATQQPQETTTSETRERDASRLTVQPDAGSQRPAHAARQKNSVRQCAATRVERPVSQLIRFVAGPDNVIYPDLGAKLPGRGVWVTADQSSISQAIKSRAFARSLKLKATVPDDLAQIVEKLLEKRVIEALSLANKAGNVVSGFDKVSALIERGRAIALVHAIDAAPGGIEKLDRLTRRKIRRAEERGEPVPVAQETIFADCLTIDQMSLAIGRSNVVHAALNKGGAAARFVAHAHRLVDYRKGVAIAPPP